LFKLLMVCADRAEVAPMLHRQRDLLANQPVQQVLGVRDHILH
jgi:hypothetical protein